MNTQKKVGEFDLNIGVPKHDVNSDTFLTSLTSITDIISIVNKDLSPSRKLEVRVKALNEGSFECSCFIQDVIPAGTALLSVIANSDLDYYKNLLSITIDILKIKQFLKGEKPVKTEEVNNGVQVKLENSYGNSIVVNNYSNHYYNNNQEVNNALSKNFEKLNSDTDVTSFSLKSSNDEFTSDRNDFPLLQKQRIVEEAKVKETPFPNQQLHMFKLVWDASNKWGFVWNGVKIQAYIKDDSFFKRIDAGEKFAKGDLLEADIRVFQIYDPSIDSYINDSYEVIAVKKHTPRPEQVELTFEEQ